MTLKKCFSVLCLVSLRAAGLMVFLFLWPGINGVAQPLTIDSTNVITGTCGSPNGSISVIVSGGTQPYQYSDDGGVTWQISNTFPHLVGGVYPIVVKDATLPVPNTQSIGVALGNIPGPTAFLLPFGASCVNDDGQLDVFPITGTPPFQYSINGGPFSTSNPITGLASGNQSVIIKDNNGCLDTTSTNIPLTDNLALAVDPAATICQGTSVMLNVATNATAFSWSPATGLDNPNAELPNASPAATTTYTLTAGLGVCVMTGTETITVLPAPIPMAAVIGSDTICYGQSVQLQGSGGVSYQWSPATYLSSATIPDPVVEQPQKSLTYALNVMGANGCVSIEPAVVMVDVTTPVVFAGNDTAVLIGQTLQLNAVDIDNSGFTNFQWSPAIGLDNPSIQDPVATITGDITYTVTASTPTGCTATASIKIVGVTVSDIVVPNAFTPNGDGHNDVLRVHLIGIKDFKYFRVFNRWGEQVFSSANEGVGWDGTVGGNAQPMGTYVWMALGFDFSGRAVERRGTVILVR
jgi:gliding motility-associated-like protein